MNINLTRFTCPDCGHEVELQWFGTPHHAGIACVECEASMDAE